MTTWNKVRNKLYYTNDDYIRDVIAFHMQDNGWDIIHNHISHDSLFSTEEDKENWHISKGSIITIFFNELSLIRWYLNRKDLLEMDIDARFVVDECIHNHICSFFSNLSSLLDTDIYILDNVIKTPSLIIMEFTPNKPPRLLEDTKYINLQESNNEF